MTPTHLTDREPHPASHANALDGAAAQGLIAAVGSSPWFPDMIGDYFAAGPVAAWPFALLGWTLCGAAYHAGLGAWMAWALRRGPLAPIAVGAGWWIIEWARTNALVGNPWALLAYSQLGYLPLAQLGDTLAALSANIPSAAQRRGERLIA